MKLLIERSKTDAEGEGAEIAIPRGQSPETCPVAALQWLTAAEISAGPLFRKVNRGGTVETARLMPDAVRQILLKRAAKAGLNRHAARACQPPRPACGLRDNCLSQWRARRGNHGAHASSEPDHDAQLRPTGQAEPEQSGGKTGSLIDLDH
jgi:hypothetical protein